MSPFRMHKYILIAFLFCSIGYIGCDAGSGNPTQEDLKGKFVQKYCSEDGKTNLTLDNNGRYTNKRLRSNPFGGASLPESCEGAYSFVEGDNSWKLVFEKSDEKSNPMLPACQGEIEIWNAEAGYLVGDSIIVLKDLFGDEAVSSANCGG